MDWEFEFNEFLLYFYIHEFFLRILKRHWGMLKIKFAVVSYDMKLENFLDLQTVKQN